MFKPIGIVFICVMLIALVETKLILPSHLAHPFLGRAGDLLEPVHNMSGRALQWFIDTVYRPSIRFAVANLLHHARPAVRRPVSHVRLFLGGRIQTAYFPRVQSERIECRLTMLEGTPVEVTDAQISRIYDIADRDAEGIQHAGRPLRHQSHRRHDRRHVFLPRQRLQERPVPRRHGDHGNLRPRRTPHGREHRRNGQRVAQAHRPDRRCRGTHLPRRDHAQRRSDRHPAHRH
jgi:multidrug efflux pump subunit AcrB